MPTGTTGPMGARAQHTVDWLVLAYSESSAVDSRMIAEDIWGSKAHAIMLARQGIISEPDLREILRWLQRARQDAESGRFELRPELEDVHMNVEAYVRENAGPDVAGRLHTGRSRNDQVVTDTRLHLRNRLMDVEDVLFELEESLLNTAQQHAATVMPGYTHTQHAQPITVGFWASGHASALRRDHERLRAAFDRTNRCPLGAAALAGSSFPIDRALTAQLLGFDGLVEHALDAVGSRDFALEALSALAILAVNLSRLAEEIVLWSTTEFGMIRLDPEVALGSSIMPQKQNPCVAELARGRTGAVFARLMQELILLKALPGGYNRDLQEDKPPLWEALDGVEATAHVLAHTVATMTIRLDRMAELAEANFETATELANFIVSKFDKPFREVHGIVGGMVRRLAEENRNFTDQERTGKLLREQGIALSADELADVLDPARSVARQKSTGSTNPQEVERMVGELRDALRAARDGVASRRGGIAQAHARTQEIAEAVIAGKALAEVL